MTVLDNRSTLQHVDTEDGTCFRTTFALVIDSNCFWMCLLKNHIRTTLVTWELVTIQFFYMLCCISISKLNSFIHSFKLFFLFLPGLIVVRDSAHIFLDCIFQNSLWVGSFRTRSVLLTDDPVFLGFSKHDLELFSWQVWCWLCSYWEEN